MTTTNTTTRKYEVLNWAKSTPNRAEFTSWDEAFKYAGDQAKANKAAGIAGAAAFNSIEIRTYEYTSESLGYIIGMPQDDEPTEEPEQAEEQVERAKDNLSDTMRTALDQMEQVVRKARNAGSFECWYQGHPKHYETWLREYTEAWGERRAQLRVKDARERYENALEGIVATGATLGTLKALERRGLIEMKLPSAYGHRVKLLTI